MEKLLLELNYIVFFVRVCVRACVRAYVCVCVCFAQQCNATDSHCSLNMRAFAQLNQIVGLTEQQI